MLIWNRFNYTSFHTKDNMITINVKNAKSSPNFCPPVEMLNNSWPEGQVFQQYFDGTPQKDYYLNCGMNEKSVVHLWWDSGNEKYSLSTDNSLSLKELAPTVQVLPIDAEITITLEKT